MFPHRRTSFRLPQALRRFDTLAAPTVILSNYVLRCRVFVVCPPEVQEMTHAMKIGLNHFPGSAALAAAIFALALPQVVEAQQSSSDEVTFSQDIAPILQRSCQNCHRPAGVAPMPLVTYRQVRRWASRI